MLKEKNNLSQDFMDAHILYYSSDIQSWADATFELEKPEILLYAPNSSGTMEFVAVEYIVPVADPDNLGTPPERFTGTLDMWEFNMERSQWQLHVWIVKDNPDGIFAPFNETIGIGN